MAEREQQAEIFRSHYPERYTGGTNTEVHPTIESMMQNCNKKFSELRISNVCKLAGVKIYRLTRVKGFDGANGQLCTCRMFTLKQCSNKLCKMAHLITTDMDKEYSE